jgi:hypothetical protein
VALLAGDIDTVKKSTETVTVVSREVDLELMQRELWKTRCVDGQIILIGSQ